jgi:hypothetical protein
MRSRNLTEKLPRTFQTNLPDAAHAQLVELRIEAKNSHRTVQGGVDGKYRAPQCRKLPSAGAQFNNEPWQKGRADTDHCPLSNLSGMWPVYT